MSDKRVYSKPRGLASSKPAVRKSVSVKGGKKIGANKDHMQSAGRKGGLAVSKNRKHMAEIGRKGALIQKAIREAAKAKEAAKKVARVVAHQAKAVRKPTASAVQSMRRLFPKGQRV